jgi:hypothetical protein
MVVGFNVTIGPEFPRVEAALGEIDKSIPIDVPRALRDAADPISRLVEAAALALPTHGTKHTGLRARLARGVGVRVDVGGGLRFTTSMAQPDEAELPRGFDSGATGFRHPVFGDRDVWVHQTGGSWFRQPIADQRGFMEKYVVDVLSDAADTVAEAGAGP